ncbi:MAG TPA: hypothetical protein VNC50_22800 [Planctomycetia bacterium]|nr:hypothetical protein [Planctomycetia bacterium]
MTWTPRPVGRGHWVAVFFLSLAASLPYVGKAFHIDDILYLRVADQIRRTPDDPYGGLVLWDAPDGQPSSLFLTDFNPPLWKYLLAATLSFGAGGRIRDAEIVMHLPTVAAVVLAGIGLFQVSRRFVRWPLWATAFMLLGPFFLPGQNLMLEAPLLAWSVWAVEAQCRAWDKPGRSWWPLFAGICCAGAALTKYTGGLLLPILLGGCWFRRRLDTAWFLIFPSLAIAGWMAFGAAKYGRSHLGAQGIAFEAEAWPLRVLCVLRTIGSLWLLLPATMLALCKEKRGVLIAFVILLASAGVAALDLWQVNKAEFLEGWKPSLLQATHFLLFTGAGTFTVLAIAALLWLSWRRGDFDSRRRFLALWLTGLFVFNVACTPFNAVRHLLLFFVPLVWLTADLVAAALEAGWLRYGSLALSAGLASALAAADYDFAAGYRTVAEREVRRLVTERNSAGRSVWFTGNWGFVHYCILAGANPWVTKPEQYGLPPIQPGDRLIHPVLLTWTDLYKTLPPGMTLATREHWQPQAEGGITPPALVGQFLRTVAPGVNYYSVRRFALPWQLLVRPAEAAERAQGMYFYLPTLGDILTYEVVAKPSSP